MPLPSVANNIAVCYTETDPYEFGRERYCNELSILRSRNDTGQSVQPGALWWQSESHRHRLNDEGGLVAKLNGYRVTAYRCEKCKKIIVDDK